jgi:serine protease Do
MRACHLLPAFTLVAAAALAASSHDALRQTSEALEELSLKVSPSVVKVLVTGYGPISDDSQKSSALIGRQHAIGSGVIVDPAGYIVTNAHVVEGALEVRVMLPPPPGTHETPLSPGPARTRILKAKIVGVDKETDLAVLKIDAEKLPALEIGDYRKLRQGQLVLAFGSPEGLEDSMSMGVISSVMRQPDPDKPRVYIQTDAAVNPGNSGGPLVDLDGTVVGINTFILSESGGSEGLNFAIPSVVVRFVYDEIRAHGRVRRPRIGVNVQSISPTLAAGMGLKQDWGLIVSDMLPDGPADKAGLRVGDILVSLDGTPLGTLPGFETALFGRAHAKPVAIEVLRGEQKLSFTVPVVEEAESPIEDLVDLVNPEKSLVRGLGILGVEITHEIAGMLEDLRVESGVIVAARAADATEETALKTGDVIHVVNGTKIESLEGLRTAVARLKPGDAVAMQIERDGILMFLAFELE